MNKENIRTLTRRYWSHTLLLVIGVVFGTCLSGPSKTTSPAASQTSDVQTIWTCSMHPQVRKTEPGQCPICGMDLIPATNGQDTELAPNEIALSAAARVRAGIRTTPVQRRSTSGVERHLLGRVDYDETSLRTVTAWVSGRIDSLNIRTTGERVRRGQVIATLYSPEVLSAHQDLIQARNQVSQLGSAATSSAQEAAGAALQAARDRLRLLGVPQGEIEQMQKASRPSDRIKIRSPFSGTIIERLATEGTYVSTGAGLYRIAGLDRLWVQLDAYESDLALLQLGQKVTLRVEALPGEKFTGRVTFMDPVLNHRTRTARVRVEVDNPKRKLAPGMFAEALVQGQGSDSDQPPMLLIPQTAPLFTGRRSVVYVERIVGDRVTYQARTVKLGARRGDDYPVLAGLTEGERVVTHGAFAIDADLQIRGGHSMMSGPDDTQPGPHDATVPIPQEHHALLQKVVTSYLELHRALASDQLEDAQKASKKLSQHVEKLSPKPGQFLNAWGPLRRELFAQSEKAATATTLGMIRTIFRDISQHVATILRIFGNPTEKTLRLAFCPMALNNSGAEWIQIAEEIENPYFGASMHRCGEVHAAVIHGAYLPGQQIRAPQSINPKPTGGHQH